MKYIRIHVYEYTEWMFASHLFRDRKLKYIRKFQTKYGVDGKRWPLTPFPFLAPWPSRPPAIETPPRSITVGPLISCAGWKWRPKKLAAKSSGKPCSSVDSRALVNIGIREGSLHIKAPGDQRRSTVLPRRSPVPARNDYAC